ncbi:hypothetical protein ACFPM7_19725 [Actinokineospora guangxiensis]|uniref:Uncharacterized protein n=1 Tax=Actinokineospora guangxiensis TaxID=1490288 RepID=A0ABW0ESE8_9PSEU
MTAQAGQVLDLYHVRRGVDHVGAAMRLRLSRATYFRRLDRGLAAVAQAVLDDIGDAV